MSKVFYLEKLNETHIEVPIKVISENNSDQHTQWVTVVLKCSQKCDCFTKCVAEHSLAEYEVLGHIVTKALDHSFVASPIDLSKSQEPTQS